MNAVLPCPAMVTNGYDDGTNAHEGSAGIQVAAAHGPWIVPRRRFQATARASTPIQEPPMTYEPTPEPHAEFDRAVSTRRPA